MHVVTARIELAHGVKVDWYGEHETVVLASTVPGRDSVDVLVEEIKRIDMGWDTTKPYRLALELAPTILLTPYSRERFAETANTNPTLYGRYALIVPASIFGAGLRMFFNFDFNR